jgi:hypothetical protein
MDSHIDLTFPEIAQIKKIKLDQTLDPRLIAKDIESSYGVVNQIGFKDALKI